jgi:hypothetical protein
VKQKTSHRIIVATAAAVSVAIFVIAIAKSSSFNPSGGLQLTQQAVSQRLYHPPQKSGVIAAVSPLSPKHASMHRVTIQSAATQNTVPAGPSKILVNTGADNTITIFCIVTAGSTVLAYARTYKKYSNTEQ